MTELKQMSMQWARRSDFGRVVCNGLWNIPPSILTSPHTLTTVNEIQENTNAVNMYNLPKHCQCFWLSIHPTIKFKRVLEGQSTHKSRQLTEKHATRTRIGRMKHLRSVRQACKLVFIPLHAEVHYSTRSNCILRGNEVIKKKKIQCWILLTSSSQAGLRL